MPDIAILGAGVSGLACAARLRERGLDSVLFDKGRSPGGRVCTRELDARSWDHGAQFVRVRDERFAALIESLAHEQHIARWDAASAEQRETFVGTPSMRQLGVALSIGLDVRSGTRVTSVTYQEGRVHLRGQAHGQDVDSALGDFATLVLALPAPQAVALVPELSDALASIEYAPCWAFMMDFDKRVALPDVLESEGSLAFAQRESSKPGRAGGERWVAHASIDFSARFLEHTQEGVVPEFLRSLSGDASALREPSYIAAHRWRYARVDARLGAPFVRRGPYAACGDGMLGGRVEAAWLSGDALGAALD